MNNITSIRSLFLLLLFVSLQHHYTNTMEQYTISKAKKKFPCLTCDKTFNQKIHLQTHERTHTGEKPYACITCDKSFADKSNLAAHERIHLKEKPYICITCDKSFALKRQLEEHKRKHTGERPYICTTCNQSFITKRNLTVHNQTHTQEKQSHLKKHKQSNKHITECLISGSTYQPIEPLELLFESNYHNNSYEYILNNG